MQSEITKLNKALKSYSSLESIKDIILFGSLMKGKDKPNDIDILIVFKSEINKPIELELRRSLGSGYEINSVTEIELESESFIAKEGLYLEGYSFVSKKFLRDSMGFGSFAFLRYDLKDTKGSDRTRFYYSLMGRNGSKGFLSELNAKRFSENVMVCDYSQIEKLKDFFDSWKIGYSVTPSLIPERLRKILLG